MTYDSLIKIILGLFLSSKDLIIEKLNSKVHSQFSRLEVPHFDF